MVERYRPVAEGVKFPPPEEKREPERKPKDTRQLVRVTYIPDHIAYLIAEGPEQSEIKWKHNGRTLIVSNESLEKIYEPNGTT